MNSASVKLVQIRGKIEYKGSNVAFCGVAHLLLYIFVLDVLEVEIVQNAALIFGSILFKVLSRCQTTQGSASPAHVGLFRCLPDSPQSLFVNLRVFTNTSPG